MSEEAKIPDEYVNRYGWTCEIGEDEQGLFVRMWNDADELHWEIRGVVVEDDGRRQKREPYTRETALKEFDRWR